MESNANARREALRKNLVQIPETRCHLRIGRLLEGVAERLRRGLRAIRALDGRNRARLRGLQFLFQIAVVRGLARRIEVVLARVVEQALLARAAPLRDAVAIRVV